MLRSLSFHKSLYAVSKCGNDNNMNNKINKTKTILFASLIAAMILPFGSMQVADATTETITDFTAYELWILDNTPSLKDISEDRKQKHISEVREYINSLSGYEKKMMAEINVLAEKYQKFNDGISQQKPEDVTDKLKQQMQT